MALDDDQKDGNKENIPLNEEKTICWQVSQSIMQKIKQEVTRQVLAELTINSSDESDEGDEREDNERQQNSDIHQSSFLSQQSDFFGQQFENFTDQSFLEDFTESDFQNNDASINGFREERTRIINRHEYCTDNTSKNKERTAINKGGDNEKKSCEKEEFITPSLCTIPGIELEHKKIILPM